MGCSSSPTQNCPMQTPHLYRQLLEQLRQWIEPKAQRHLQGFAEVVAAILQSQSACLSRWLPYLSHRNCKARSHMERLNYFVHNDHICAQTFYAPLLKQFLHAFAGEALQLTLDTSMLWDQFCLVEVCLIWGGRSISLSQVVLEHGSATVGFEQYRPILEAVFAVLPPQSSVTLLAERGFEHGELIRWLQRNGWSWAIRAPVRSASHLARQARPGAWSNSHHRLSKPICSGGDGVRRYCLPFSHGDCTECQRSMGGASAINLPHCRRLRFMADVLVALNPISKITSLPPFRC